jgi:restriction system protein
MEKHKGHWGVTDLGKEAMAQFKDPEDFYREALRLYHAWKNSFSDEVPDNKSPNLLGEEEASAAITFEKADEQAWEQIESHLGRMPPYDFQHLVAGLLKAMGYHIAWVAPPGKDGGVDIIATQDPLGIKPPRVKIQVKRQQQAVSIDGLRTFMALLGEGDVGVFVSLGGFTKDSQESARYQESRRITLIDSEKLTDLWIEHFANLEEEYKALFRLKPIYFLAPNE